MYWDAYGFPCVIARGYFLALCGYVGVREGHPWYMQPHQEIQAVAHGPLTFSGPRPGIFKPRTEDRWWVGFDCGHGFDLVPALEDLRRQHGLPGSPQPAVYRTVAYVYGVTELLALQAHAACD